MLELRCEPLLYPWKLEPPMSKTDSSSLTKSTSTSTIEEASTSTPKGGGEPATAETTTATEAPTSKGL